MFGVFEVVCCLVATMTTWSMCGMCSNAVVWHCSTVMKTVSVVWECHPTAQHSVLAAGTSTSRLHHDPS